MKKLIFAFLLSIPLFSFGQILINPNSTINTARYNAAVMGSVAVSGTNSYTLNYLNTGDPATGITTYTGFALNVTFTNPNSTSSTFNLNGLGDKTMKKYSGGVLSDLALGDIGTGERKRIWYDGAYIVIEGGSGGGGNTYGGNSPTTVTVGGLPAGSAIAGDSYDEILEAIVAPYVNPVFTSFSVTGQATTVEVGTTLSGSKTFTWGITVNSGVVSTIDLYDNTAVSTLLAATPNDGTQAQTVTTIQLNSNGATQSWKGIGNNSSPAGTFNSSNFVVTGRFYRFFGPVSSSPTNSATVRAISSGTFHTGATTFNLTTGTTLTKFVCALPPGVTITSVIDLDALNADITAQYVLTGTISVLDAGSTGRTYNIYEMNVGSPYGVTHRHAITTAN